MRGHNYIDGGWIGGGAASPDINPSNVADVVGEYAQADARQANDAIASARQAFPAWSQSSIQLRADILVAIGKFHGVIMPMTPTGSRVISTVMPGRTEGTSSPFARSASPAKNLKM